MYETLKLASGLWRSVPVPAVLTVKCRTDQGRDRDGPRSRPAANGCCEHVLATLGGEPQPDDRRAETWAEGDF